MTAFLFYTIVLICLGILIRIFWVPLMAIFTVLLGILLIICWSGITAFTIECIKALVTDGTWSGFATFFKYSLVFYTVATVVYFSILFDLLSLGSGWLLKTGDIFLQFKNKERH